MDRFSGLIIAGIGMVLIVTGIQAFSLSSVTVTPAGTLNPGDAVTITYTVYAASGTAFPSYDDLQFTTTLENRLWTYSIIVNSVENARPQEITRTLTVSGFELSYEDKDEVLVRVDLKGKIPATAATGATRNLVTIQELDARGVAINSTVIAIDRLIGTPTPTPTPAFGSISVSSDPSNADVYLNNVYKGFTPLTLDAVPNGDYTVVIRHQGFLDLSRAVRVTGNSPAVRATLIPLTTMTTVPESGQTTAIPATTQPGKTTAGETGSLNIDSKPSGAAVYIDGDMKGNTPATISGLSPGRHIVQLVLAGYSALNTTVTIESGTMTVYSTGLVPPEKTPGLGIFYTVLSLLVVFWIRKTR